MRNERLVEQHLLQERITSEEQFCQELSTLRKSEAAALSICDLQRNQIKQLVLDLAVQRDGLEERLSEEVQSHHKHKDLLQDNIEQLQNVLEETEIGYGALAFKVAGQTLELERVNASKAALCDEVSSIAPPLSFV